MSINLWIFYVGSYAFVYALRKWAEKKRGEPFEDPELENQKQVIIPATIWMLSGLILSIFIPIRFGIAFYIGLFVAAFGLIIVGFSFYSFSQNKGLNTSKIHRYTRNPNYIGWDIFMGSLILIGWSEPIWNILLVVYFLMTLFILHYMILQEENFLTNKYGEKYKDYLAKTPRYFGKPKN